MQSSFSTLKSGLADWFDNFGETKMEVFDYMEAIREPAAIRGWARSVPLPSSDAPPRSVLHRGDR